MPLVSIGSFMVISFVGAPRVARCQETTTRVDDSTASAGRPRDVSQCPSGVRSRPGRVRQNHGMRNDRLREAMTAAGLSQDGLAEAVGVDPKSVWRWMNKGVVPRLVGMKGKVAEVL